MLTVSGRAEEFDLVLATDGIRSDARSRWALDRGIRYAGYTVWRGVTTSTGHLSNEAGETWDRGARFGIVPLPDDRVYWFATRSTLPDGTDHDTLATIQRLFRGWHAPISELLDATNPGTILRHDIYDLPTFPASFVHQRTALLGDAAHAMTPDLGQGAGQAIEDAATLAILLRGANAAQLDGGLQQYDHLRRSRTRPIWRHSRLTGKLAQSSSAMGVRLRDAALQLAPASLMTGAMARLQSWQPPET